MNDQGTRITAFLVALAFHAVFLVMAAHQYLASGDKPHHVNQTAERLATLNGQPVRFIYVKDMVSSPLPPMDPSRLSDMNRHGASPDQRKGSSPDPTSLGQSGNRQLGGPGDASMSRPSSQGSPESPPPQRGSQAGASGQRASQSEAAQKENQEAQKQAQAAQQASRRASNKDAKPGQGQGATAAGQPVQGDHGLPVGGEQTSVARAAPSPAPSPAPGPPGEARSSPSRQGLGTSLQQMMLGSLQGGYHNPNASRLNTGSLSFDTAGWDLGPYARKVQERVQSNWHTPAAEESLRQKGWVAIHFNVQKDGSITDLQIVRGSGIPSYDQSAYDALRSSNPLPPLPEEVTVPQISGLYRFFYNIQDNEE